MEFNVMAKAINVKFIIKGVVTVVIIIVIVIIIFII